MLFYLMGGVMILMGDFSQQDQADAGSASTSRRLGIVSNDGGPPSE